MNRNPHLMMRCGLRFICKDVQWLTNRKLQPLSHSINSVGFIQSVGTYSQAAMICEKPLPDSVPKQRGMSEKRNLELEFCQGKEILLPKLTPAVPHGPS